jgi:hypothetical protein
MEGASFRLNDSPRDLTLSLDEGIPHNFVGDLTCAAPEEDILL